MEDSVKSNTFYGDSNDWRLSGGFHGENMVIKLPDNLHINFSIKCP